MGDKVAYQPCPISPKRPGWGMRELVVSLTVALLVGALLIVSVLYGMEAHSDRAKQLQECQSQRQNGSFQMQAQIAALQQQVDETQKAARKAAEISSHQLEAMNKSLEETQEKWHSCQNQENELQENITSLEALEQLQKEKVTDLQRQLTEKSKQLDDERRKIQEERMHHQEEIRKLKEQQARRQQDTSNGGWAFTGPSITLLTIVIAGCLSM